MSEAPERIWAFYAPEIEADNPQCTIVAGEAVMYGAQQYVRADLIEELETKLAKARVEGFWAGRSCGGSKKAIDTALAKLLKRQDEE